MRHIFRGYPCEHSLTHAPTRALSVSFLLLPSYELNLGSWAHAKRLREAEAKDGLMGGSSNPACFPDWGAFPPLESFPNTFGIDEVLQTSQLRRTRGKNLIPVSKLEMLVHRCVRVIATSLCACVSPLPARTHCCGLHSP